MDTSLADRLRSALNAQDLEALVACFAEDYRCEFPAHPARGFVGREHVRENWTRLFALVPDLHTSVAGRAVTGDEVWSEWRMAGHSRDDGEFAVRDQRITHARFYMEPLDGTLPATSRAGFDPIATRP